jgi:Pretoxin HINT domain
VLDTADPQQMNGYAYAGNNPVTASDPSGLRPTCGDDGHGCAVGEDGWVPNSSYWGGGGGSGLSDCTYGSASCTGYRPPAGGWTWSHRVLPHGTVVTFTEGHQLINNTDVTEPLDDPYAPTFTKLANDVDDYTGKHPPSEVTFSYYSYDEWSDWIIYQTTTEAGYSTKTSIFHFWLIGLPPGNKEALASGQNMSMDMLMMASGARGGGRTGPRGPRLCNSFDPDTPVLMADGTEKPIKDVQIGDQVRVTEPNTDRTQTQTVVALHINQDTDLADVIVVRSDGRTAVLHTTPRHPFWDSTSREWVYAGQLEPGHELRSSDGSTVRIVDVDVFAGQHEMRDLTVSTIHTYYVVAGTTPVLVHNSPCGLKQGVFGQSQAHVEARINDVVYFYDMHGRPPAGTFQHEYRGRLGGYGNMNERLPLRSPDYYTETDLWPQGTLPGGLPVPRNRQSPTGRLTSSVAGERIGGIASGAGGALQEVGEQFEFGIGVSGTDRVHGSVHPRVEVEHLRAAVAQRSDDDGAAVGVVAVAGHPAAGFQPVDDAGHGGRVQPGAAGERAGTERPVPVDQLEAAQVGVLELEMGADLVVEQGQLDAQLAQCVLDRGGRPTPPAAGAGAGR